ncbi:MAG: hypothetical protein J6C93_05195 [Clostridia bacterium]|nr:hypothetical protein [Clostridia bacterium]
MKKRSNFLTRLPLRLYALLFAFLAFAFFSNDFGLVDIQKTAIILAAGVDKEEEGLRLTAQIAVPQGSGSSFQSGSVNLDGTGATVSECLSDLYAQTGWVPKFIFCDLVLFGEELARENVFSALDFFLRNEYVPDSCNLAVCQGTAKDLLTQKSAIDDTSSFALSKLFSDAAQKAGKVVTTTLKEFSIGYYGVSHSGYMPMIQTLPSDNDVSAQASSQEGANSKEKKQNVVYVADQTALFADGALVSVLSPEQTFAYNLLRGKVFAGTFPVRLDGVTYSLSVLKNDGESSLVLKDEATALLRAQVSVRLYSKNTPSSSLDVASGTVDERVVKEAESTLAASLVSLWENSTQKGCDLFFLLRQLYRSSLQKYEEEKEGFLSSVRPQIQVTVKTFE